VRIVCILLAVQGGGGRTRKGGRRGIATGSIPWAGEKERKRDEQGHNQATPLSGIEAGGNRKKKGEKEGRGHFELLSIYKKRERSTRWPLQPSNTLRGEK